MIKITNRISPHHMAMMKKMQKKEIEDMCNKYECESPEVKVHIATPEEIKEIEREVINHKNGV